MRNIPNNFLTIIFNVACKMKIFYELKTNNKKSSKKYLKKILIRKKFGKNIWLKLNEKFLRKTI